MSSFIKVLVDIIYLFQFVTIIVLALMKHGNNFAQFHMLDTYLVKHKTE